MGGSDSLHEPYLALLFAPMVAGSKNNGIARSSVWWKLVKKIMAIFGLRIKLQPLFFSCHKLKYWSIRLVYFVGILHLTQGTILNLLQKLSKQPLCAHYRCPHVGTTLSFDVGKNIITDIRYIRLDPNHVESIIIGKESDVAVGRLASLPSPAASSDSSIVYAGSRSCLHLLLWILLRQCEWRAASVS